MTVLVGQHRQVRVAEQEGHRDRIDTLQQLAGGKRVAEAVQAVSPANRLLFAGEAPAHCLLVPRLALTVAEESPVRPLLAQSFGNGEGGIAQVDDARLA